MGGFGGHNQRSVATSRHSYRLDRVLELMADGVAVEKFLLLRQRPLRGERRQLGSQGRPEAARAVGKQRFNSSEGDGNGNPRFAGWTILNQDHNFARDEHCELSCGGSKQNDITLRGERGVCGCEVISYPRTITR